MNNVELTWKDVELGDDGTLDTVLWIDGCEHRYNFNEGRPSFVNNKDNPTQAWTSLAKECVEDHYTNCLIERGN